MTDQAERLREMLQGRQAYTLPRKRRLSRIIVIASGKGGVGKTNLVVNLGILLGQWGQKVIILDTDLGMANVDILLGLKPRFTLVDVIKGKKDLSEIILHGPANIEIIPGGSGLSEIINLDNHQREQLISRLSYLEEKEHIMLVDCAAGLSRDVISYIASADELILVTTPEPTAITDVYSIIKVVSKYRLHSQINLVINMVHTAGTGEDAYRRLNNACQNFLGIEISLLGCLDYDHKVHQAVLGCSPYILHFPRSQVAHCTRQVARVLLYDEETTSAGEKKGDGFFKRLFQLWR